MSIGQLGSAGEQFRDFLGGSQKDIGQGLQAVLSNYSNPDGNFVRLEERSQGMFQLTNAEYQSVFDQDAHNKFAETWYKEYRAILILRAEALKKKLNRSYNQVLENSIYAPMRPDEAWAPGANRDHNDILATDPLQIYSETTGTGGPVIPTDTMVDSTNYVHPDWFSGTTGGGPPLSTGQTNAYDDIRRYVNDKYGFDDMDGDGTVEIGRTNDPNPATPYDGSYSYAPGGESSTYYNLWDTNTLAGTANIYDMESLSFSNGYSNSRYNDIATNMNVPPSTSTQNFVTSGGANTYYIQLPKASDAMTATQRAPLPSFVTAQDPDNDGIFTKTQKNALVTAGMSAGDFTTVGTPIGTKWVINAGTKFYDPNGVVSQAMFSPSPANDVNGEITGIAINPDIVGPPGASLDEKDQNATTTGLPIYHYGFVDSWREARQVQRREAQIEAAYQAYKDGSALIGTGMTYEQVMDNVFSSIDQVGGSGGPLPPGTPPPVPASTPSSGNFLNNIQPYGYQHTYSGSGPTFVVKHASSDSPYDTGSAYGDVDPGSIYDMIYQRLSIAADPTSITGGNSGSTALSGSLGPPSTFPPPPPTGFPPGSAPQDRNVVGGSNPSHLYSPFPVGAAELNDGQPNINDPSGVSGLDDVLHQVPSQAQQMDTISKLFVGRQWDYSPGFQSGNSAAAVAGTDDIAPVKYDAETISSHLMVIPGWFYDAGSDLPNVGKALLTLPPAIDSFAWQSAANTWGIGKFDDIVNKTLGGPFFHVGGGSDSLGIIDLDGTSTKYSIAVGFGMGIGGVYWGHTSAIGTIGKIQELMDNSGADKDGTYPNINSPDPGQGPDVGSPGPAFDIMKASLQIAAGIGGASVDDMSVYPNVGLAGFHFDANIPIPIPPPAGLSFLNVPMTTYGAVSYDMLTDYMYKFLDGMKHEVIDSLSVYSYATSGGYAMDSYGMRGEYDFTEKTAFNSLKKMPDLFGIVPVADLLKGAVGMVGLDSYNINNYNLNEEGVFDGDKRHSMQAAEARELDTGAFFTTAAFLSQFQLNNLEYSYWTTTHQNEEAANMDTLRMVSLTGKEMMKFLSKFIFGMAGNIDWDGPWAAVTLTVLNFMLSSFQNQLNEAMMWDLLMRDQNETGFVTTAKITSSSLTSEGYDFIEDERKLFAYDYEQNQGSVGAIGKLATIGMGSFEIPNTVMNGMANTRRYKPYLQGPDGRAGRQGYGTVMDQRTVVDYGPNKEILGTVSDPHRANELTRHIGDTSRYDDNWDLRVGFWQDTGLGDINEVYVRKNTVSYGSIDNGLDGMAPTVNVQVDRYVGSHNRIIGRGYDGASPLNLQSFRTGYFADKYFGTYISEAEPALGDIEGVSGNDRVQYSMTTPAGTGMDGDTDGNIDFYLHGGEKYYDRRNDYTFSMDTQSGTNIQLRGDQALAPVFGGRMKLTTIDMNDPTQDIGASTIGKENTLTQTLYDYLRVKADGSNAQLVKEYRDVFNTGLLDDIFVSSSANAPMGGGVTSSIRIKFRGGIDATANPATANAAVGADIDLGAYEDRRSNEIVGSTNVIDTTGTAVTQNLLTEPGFLGTRQYFTNTNRALADIYLSSYFAFKRQPNSKAS